MSGLNTVYSFLYLVTISHKFWYLGNLSLRSKGILSNTQKTFYNGGLSLTGTFQKFNCGGGSAFQRRCVSVRLKHKDIYIL